MIMSAPPTYTLEKTDSDNFILNLGPQHPGTHGVLRVVLQMDGEYILRADPVLGYGHRMQEKIAENMTYLQALPYVCRMDYLGALSYNLAWVCAVEKLCGFEVPERAIHVRVIATELNRIASHLLWWGAYLLDLGAFTPFLQAFTDREQILDLLEYITGSRLTYCYFRFGGLGADVDDLFLARVEEFVTGFRSRLPRYHDLVTGNVIFHHRSRDVGVILPFDAAGYGITGPSLRASGYDFDVRKKEPYSGYDRFEFTVPVEQSGDCLARYNVRMAEMEQSLAIIEQAVSTIPDGPFRSKVPKQIKPPEGEVAMAVETPRGELVIYIVSDGTRKPYRVKFRVPSFSNLSIFSKLARGQLLADALAILGSLDMVIPEVDR
ncbi:NADH-quinone oxidoreductase subunit D [Desulfolithobacter dissulfuricans]|uniref:NADH-quinone oxidoreductase subunit D n=2 Tax=Desulfolithobacter dissulfuricans TaxID=2795293 RepID=A0A915UB82_9BACT|nr:NADH-quinone oxidoreductase subunit D [Desulfolithobacter dissulfuricans]